jgi:O-antigen ligase
MILSLFQLVGELSSPSGHLEHDRGSSLRSASSRQARLQAGRQPSLGGRPLPWDLLLGCTGVYIATAAGRLHTLIGPLASIRPLVLVAGLGLILYALDRTPARSIAALKQPMPLIVLFILGWATLGAPFALYPGLAVTMLSDKLYKMGLLFLLCAAAVRNLHDVRRLMFVYAIAAVIYSAHQVMLGGYRGAGAGGYDANDAAMFIVSALPILVYFLLHERGAVVKLSLGAGLLICLIAVVKSGSRGGFLALVAVLAYTVLASRSIRMPMRLGIGVFVVTGFVFVSMNEPEYIDRIKTLGALDEDYNSHELFGRKLLWRRGAEYMFANPMLGVGLENFYVAEAQHPVVTSRIESGLGAKYSAPHSQWVQAGAELGFPGLLAFAALYIFPLVQFRRWSARARRRDGRDAKPHEVASMADALAGTLLALAVAGTFLSQAYGLAVWAAFGLSAGFLKAAAVQQTNLAAAPAVTPERRGRGALWQRSSGRSDAFRN